MVVDQDLCDGCGKCTEACISEHRVPPAWGEPSYHGAQEWIEVFKNEQNDGGEAVFQPTLCMNCQNAPCVKVCPVGATYYNEDGIVLIDNTRCIGCRFCMAACPYSRRYFNWGEPPHSADEVLIQYNPEYPVPHRRGTVEKCHVCAHRVKNGRLPACVEMCKLQGMKALYFGDSNEDVVTNGEEAFSPFSWSSFWSFVFFGAGESMAFKTSIASFVDKLRSWLTQSITEPALAHPLQ